MSDGVQTTGRCLCGTVKYQVQMAVDTYGVCHCDMCRRWTSGPFFAISCGTDVKFDGEQNIGRYRSSDWAERGFCKTCGSSLFYYIIANGQYRMAVGTMDDQTNLRLFRQVFIDEKPDGYDFANATDMLTGKEAFAPYAPKA